MCWTRHFCPLQAGAGETIPVEAKLTFVVRPTLRPKPRKMPLRLISTPRSSSAPLNVELGLHKLAGRQKRARLLRRHRLAMHRPEPAEPHRLSDTACIVPVRLHWHCLEGGVHMPRLQQLHGKPRARAKGSALNQAIKSSGSLKTFASRTILPEASTTQTLEAVARSFQGHVNPCIIVHGHPSRCLELPARTPLNTISLRDDRQDGHGLGRGSLRHPALS